MAELHDLSFGYQAGPLLRLLSQETQLVPDLLRARPWLVDLQTREEVLSALLEQEWTGFVARLGGLGPWVFAPSVADLQALSAAYTSLVEHAVGRDLSGREPESLLGRLWSGGDRAGREPPDAAVQAEDAFWTLAESRAVQRRQAWAETRDGR